MISSLEVIFPDLASSTHSPRTALEWPRPPGQIACAPSRPPGPPASAAPRRFRRGPPPRRGTPARIRGTASISHHRIWILIKIRCWPDAVPPPSQAPSSIPCSDLHSSIFLFLKSRQVATTWLRSVVPAPGRPGWSGRARRGAAGRRRPAASTRPRRRGWHGLRAGPRRPARAAPSPR